MSEIQIFFTMQPKRGAFIPKGRCVYVKTAEGVPSMRVTWKTPEMMGLFFSSDNRTFIFAEHANKISVADDKFSQGAARWGNSSRASNVPGIIGLAGFAADVVSGATNDTSSMKGFVFTYSNDQGHGGLCWAVASGEATAEIFASVSPERIDPSIVPKIKR